MRPILPLLLLLALGLVACPANRRSGGGGGDDDDSAGDDDDAADDDDAVGGGCDGLVLPLEGSGVSCQMPWTENGATLSLVPHCSSDSCSGELADGSMWIYPGQLLITFEGLDCVPNLIEADVTDWAGSGAASMTLHGLDGPLDEVTNSGTGSLETLTVESPGGAVAAVGFCGFETQIHEVRLY